MLDSVVERRLRQGRAIGGIEARGGAAERFMVEDSRKPRMED
jgi:hypothetical protein